MKAIRLDSFTDKKMQEIMSAFWLEKAKNKTLNICEWETSNVITKENKTYFWIELKK